MRSLFIFPLVIFFLLAFAPFADAQSVTGSWYGIAGASTKGENTNNYMIELVIKQKGNDVEGIFGYYFRTGYQSLYIRGNFNPKTRQLTIKNLPLSWYKNRDIDGVECPMDFSATLMTSKVQSTLTGVLTSQDKYKYACPPITFTSSLDESEKNQDSLIHNYTAVKKYWKPRAEEVVINTSTGAVVPLAPPKIEATLTKDSAQKILDETARKAELVKLVSAFEQRKNISSGEIEVESDSVRVSFYDNGDIDGDSITVFINKVPVLTHQPLTAKSLNMYLAIDPAKPAIEITMYAENLGLYPPNTALMVITDGTKRHEVYLSSSLTQNASVVIKRKKR